MTHKDIELLILGSLIPNNVLIWLFAPLFRRPRNRKPGGFARFAQGFGNTFGSAPSFIIWVILLGLWIWIGPYFHWNNTWQLMANTPTTWLELFAAITIQYVGNRIERRQERHEQHMLAILQQIQANTDNSSDWTPRRGEV